MIETKKESTNSLDDSSVVLFKNKKILIHGLGLNNGGVGVVKFLANTGAKIRITDLRDAKTLKPSLDKIADLIKKYNIELVLGEHREQDFKWADIVIRNPAIPVGNKYIKIAQEHGAKVFMDVSLFVSLVNNTVIGVTGTKGKSTTTTLIYEFLKEHYENKRKTQKQKNDIKVWLAGNIGQTPMEIIPELKPQDIVVLELSSFQLSVMGENKQSPHIAVVTNVYTDHINWHKTFDHYLWSKMQIAAHQNANDYLIINLESPHIEDFINVTNAKIIGISLNLQIVKKYKTKLYGYAYIEGDKIYIDKRCSKSNNWHSRRLMLDLSNIKLRLKGKHNKYNILLAIAATYLTDQKVTKKDIIKVLETFTGAYGRQQYVASLGKIDFYNDTAATVDVAIKAAIDRFADEYKGRVVFIMGGMDKGIDYQKAISSAKDRVLGIVLLEGTASEKIQKVANELGILTRGLYSDFKQAIKKACKLAQKYVKSDNKKVAVVLTPGATSFNMFLNEWDRGHKYDALVQELVQNKC